LDLLQFSGDESPEFCGSFGKPTILTMREWMLSAEQLKTAKAVAVLIDSWFPGRYGGTGKVVEPAAATAAREQAAHAGAYTILAGGLTPANVKMLACSVKADAVDVRTGVERDGRKDPVLVRSFITAAREALN
jgi:phosphoribosylanthranilate isomerase